MNISKSDNISQFASRSDGFDNSPNKDVHYYKDSHKSSDKKVYKRQFND